MLSAVSPRRMFTTREFDSGARTGPGVSASMLFRFLLRYEEVVEVAGLGWSYGGGGGLPGRVAER